MLVSTILLSILIAYIFLFILFFIFPNLIHKKHTFKISQKVINSKYIASLTHRGGMKENPENSLPAFKHTILLNYFGIELDVHKTKCGKLIVAHDVDLSRITGQHTLITEIDYKDINPYLEEIRDVWSDQVDTFNNPRLDKPPLLDDVFQLIKNEKIMLNIDVKSNDENDFAFLCDEIVRLGLSDRVVIGGFASDKYRGRMQAMAHQLPMFFGVNECAWFFISSLLGFLPFVHFKNDWIEIPHAFKHMREAVFAKRSFLIKLLLCVLWVQSFFFRPIVWHMNRRGIPVIFWVLNCQEDWEKAIKMGGNGLMTDCPSKMKLFLQEKGLFEDEENLTE